MQQAFIQPSLPTGAHRRANRAIAMSSQKSLGVVVTGSTKGVGRALAEEFLENKDRVVVTSRTEDAVRATVNSLKRRFPLANVYGCVTDVRDHSDVSRLVDFASENLGNINAFICNAGTTGSRGPLRDVSPEDLRSVVETNLLGPMFCAKEGIRGAEGQTEPMHLFIMDGSGTSGNATAEYAAYGATKRAIPQLVKSLRKETDKANIRFHPLSPGMVLTDLLLGGDQQPPKVRMIFNFLAEEPETVAAEIVPKIREAVIADRRHTYIQFLTIPKALYRLTTGFLLGFRKNMFFDATTGKRIDQGDRYSEIGVRLKD